MHHYINCHVTSIDAWLYELSHHRYMCNYFQCAVCFYALTHTCVDHNPYFDDLTSCRWSSLLLSWISFKCSTQVQFEAPYYLLFDRKFQHCDQNHLQFYLHITKLCLLINVALVNFFLHCWIYSNGRITKSALLPNESYSHIEPNCLFPFSFRSIFFY